MTDDGVHALRQARDVGGQVGGFQRGLHTVAVDVLAQRHVGGNALVQHHHVLRDHGDLRAQRHQRPLVQRDAIQQHTAAGGQHEARQKVDQRGLARAGWADEGDDFAGGDGKAHALQGRGVFFMG